MSKIRVEVTSHHTHVFNIDACTLQWGHYFFYAFPPFSVILKCLRKIIDDARGIMVVPHWPSQPRYSLSNSLHKTKPMLFSPQSQHLISPCKIGPPPRDPLCQRLTLVSTVLSGEHFLNKNLDPEIIDIMIASLSENEII